MTHAELVAFLTTERFAPSPRTVVHSGRVDPSDTPQARWNRLKTLLKALDPENNDVTEAV